MRATLAFNGLNKPVAHKKIRVHFTAWRVSKYGKYEPEKTPYLDTFHAVFRTPSNIYVDVFLAKIVNGIYSWTVVSR